MDVLPFLSTLKEYFIAWGIVLTLLTVLELLNPRERHPLRARLAGISFWAISIAFSLMLAKSFAAGWRMIGVDPLLSIPSLEPYMRNTLAAAAAAGVIAALVHDFSSIGIIEHSTVGSGGGTPFTIRCVTSMR